MNVECDLSKLKFNESGLIPAIVCDATSKELLMMAFMNKESLKQTLAIKEAVFYSRSRLAIWHKGATSGNVLKIQAIYVDCDYDCLQLEVEVKGAGVACHTGKRSCFFRKINLEGTSDFNN